MHLVGFTIEIYYDARSYKRHICKKEGCVRNGVDGLRCGWCELLLDIWYRCSIPLVRDLSIFGLS